MFRRKQPPPQPQVEDIGVQPGTLFNNFLAGNLDKFEAEREGTLLSVETESNVVDVAGNAMTIKTQYVYDAGVLVEVSETNESAPVIKFTRGSSDQGVAPGEDETSPEEELTMLLSALKIEGAGVGSIIREGTNVGRLIGAQGKKLIVKFEGIKQAVLVGPKGVRYFDKNDHLIGRS